MDPFSDYDYRSDDDLARELELIVNELRGRGYSVTIEDGKINIVKEDDDE